MNSRCFIGLMLGKVVSSTLCPRSLFQLTKILCRDHLAVIDSILEIKVQTWYCQLEGLPVWEELCVYLGQLTSCRHQYCTDIHCLYLPSCRGQAGHGLFFYFFLSLLILFWCRNPWLRRLLLGKPQMSGSVWEALTPTSCFCQFIHSLLAALSDTQGSRLVVLQMAFS